MVVTSFTRDGDTGSRVLHAIIGVLSVIVGFALLRTPFQSVEVFIFVLGIFWLVQGIMTFVAAFAVKQGRNWRLFSGLLGVLAGIIILVYPITSARDARLHRRHLAGHPGRHADRRRVPAAARAQPDRVDAAGLTSGPPARSALRAILSRGADPAPTTRAVSASARGPASLAPA